MDREAHAKDLFHPLIILAVFAVVMLFAGGLVMANVIDRGAKERAQVEVANGVKNRVIDMYRHVSGVATRPDAFSHLSRGDAGWAARFVGPYLHDIAGFEYSFVLGGSNRVFFASHNGAQRPTRSYEMFARSMHYAVETLRVREQRAHRNGSAISGFSPEHNVVKAGNGVYFVVADLVRSGAGQRGQPDTAAPIIIAAYPIDSAFLKRLGDNYLRPDLELRYSRARDTVAIGQLELNDDQGRYVASLYWPSGRPGTMWTLQLAGPAVILIAFFFFMMTKMHQRSWRAAQALIASEARASHMAYHDPLTALPNRLMFFDRLEGALDQVRRNGTPVAVHCIDLDRFKEVNDTFGHQMGDELIMAAARRISDICRRSDTFARLSGDEFAIVQLDANPLAASRLAERIVKAMAQPMELSGGRVHISCSLGVNIVSEIPRDAKISAAEILRQADLALYRAKHNGRDQYSFFEPEMDAVMRMRREIEIDLRKAVSEGGLRMVYQPQADKSGRIIGVEALVRWRHPTRGEISPALFIQVAEECGLINEIGLFTLRESFRASHRWKGLKVAINISASQLRMRDFHRQLSELVEECEVDPRNFELEITEGLLLGDDPVTHDTLMKLRNMGFSIALDDFGTGYSSLSYLQRYPIDKIKIDRSFVANLGVESEARAVVRAIVKLARALRLHVIAEGVETDEQREYLINIGCEEIQGFLYSQPVDPEAIAIMYTERGGLETREA